MARDDAVIAGFGDITRHEASVSESTQGVGLGQIDEIGHGHRLGTEREDIGHRGTGIDLGIGRGIGADDMACDDAVIAGFGDITRHEASVSESTQGVGLGQIDEIGHGHRLGTTAHDERDRCCQAPARHPPLGRCS